MRSLYLVRHGETAWNAERRLQGREDLRLSENGRRQSLALRATLVGLLAGLDTHVVCSPLTRARETCELLDLRPDVVDGRWQEADLGAWTGRTREELVAVGDGAYAAWRAGALSPPGAEQLEDLGVRVEEALLDLPPAATTIVVTHGGPIRAACRALVGLEPGHLVPVHPGSLTVIDLDDSRPRLRAYNLTPRAGEELLVEPPD